MSTTASEKTAARTKPQKHEERREENPPITQISQIRQKALKDQIQPASAKTPGVAEKVGYCLPSH